MNALALALAVGAAAAYWMLYPDAVLSVPLTVREGLVITIGIPAGFLVLALAVVVAVAYLRTEGTR